MVRAIDTVERALKLYGATVYVRQEIVHNRYVVESLREKGAIFVAELNEIPETNAPVVFSAHGVPKAIPNEADKRNFFTLDATCPLVTKVHREAAIHFKRGREILLIGHSHHPEVVGTLGQLPEGADHFRMTGMADQDDFTAALEMDRRLAVNLGHQRAGRIQREEIAPFRLARDRLRHAMGRKHHRSVGFRDFFEFLDENRALGAQAIHHITIVHDLVPDIDRRAIER